MKKHFYLLISLLCSFQCYSQNIKVSNDIDTTILKVKEPLGLFINFLKTADDSAGSAYWNNAEVEKYGKSNYFLVENEINRGTGNYLFSKNGCYNTHNEHP